MYTIPVGGFRVSSQPLHPQPAFPLQHEAGMNFSFWTWWKVEICKWNIVHKLGISPMLKCMLKYVNLLDATSFFSIVMLCHVMLRYIVQGILGTNASKVLLYMINCSLQLKCFFFFFNFLTCHHHGKIWQQPHSLLGLQLEPETFVLSPTSMKASMRNRAKPNKEDFSQHKHRSLFGSIRLLLGKWLL